MSVAIDISYSGIAVISLVFAGIGLYIKTYVTKKAENLATREDVAAITQTTKSIEAKISDEFWNKQRQWELKRDVLFQAAVRLAEIDSTLLDQFSIGQLVKDMKVKDVSAEQSEAHDRWSKATRALDETILLVGIVCGTETMMAIKNFRSVAYGLIVKLFEDKDAGAYSNSKDRYNKNLEAARGAIRKELGIEE
jgi:hypothetical protein